MVALSRSSKADTKKIVFVKTERGYEPHLRVGRALAKAFLYEGRMRTAMDIAADAGCSDDTVYHTHKTLGSLKSLEYGAFRARPVMRIEYKGKMRKIAEVAKLEGMTHFGVRANLKRNGGVFIPSRLSKKQGGYRNPCRAGNIETSSQKEMAERLDIPYERLCRWIRTGRTDLMDNRAAYVEGKENERN